MTKATLSRSSVIIVSAGALAAVAIGAGAANAAFSSYEADFTRKGVPFVKGELLVKTRSKAALERFAASSRESVGMLVERTAISESAEGAWFKVKVEGDKSMQEAYDLARDVEGVEFAEPNYIYSINLGGPRPAPKPGDQGPDYDPVPALPSEPVADPDLSKLYGLSKIDAQEAWLTTRGSANVVVADIDTGVDYNHKDLINNIWRNPNEIPGNGIDDDKNGLTDDMVGYDYRDKDARPFDDNQHGSHTSGTIAATGGNGVGVSGVAQRSSIMVLRFLGGAQGSGTSEDAIKSVDYATANGAQIMSNSWGGGGFSQALLDSIKKANDKGILFVAAAGNASSNNDTSENYPSNYDVPNVLAVAATDSNDKMASFSNYGVTQVDLAAPGVNIFSTVPGNRYAQFSGTSMAAPHVAGAAALVLSAFPRMKAADLKAVLMDSVDTVPSLDGKLVTGGRLNVSKALATAKERFAR
ncbi:MAG: S8 family serine peptidase [Silvanigrellales bacterium]|nr:S8 family serine peptidase [Silvanigrellales bacterium]